MASYVTAKEARCLFGRDFFGPEAFSAFLGEEDLFGPALTTEQVDESLRVPFSMAELERAKSLGMVLVFRISRDKYGNGLTIRYIRDACARDRAHPETTPIFGNGRKQPWYSSEDFARNEIPNAGWALVRMSVIPGSLDSTWTDQSKTLTRWTEENGIETRNVRRRTAVEAVYDALLYHGQNRQSEVQLAYDWTATRSSDDWPVFVACYDSRIWIDALLEDAREPCLGVYPALLSNESRSQSVVSRVTEHDDPAA